MDYYYAYNVKFQLIDSNIFMISTLSNPQYDQNKECICISFQLTIQKQMRIFMIKDNLKMLLLSQIMLRSHHAGVIYWIIICVLKCRHTYFFKYFLFSLIFFYKVMNSFKSSPLIQDYLRPKFSRNTKRVSKHRNSKQQQFLIANPFRQGQQENYLPIDLKQQIQQLDYISPNQVQGISFTNASGARRSSTFARHLQTMQNAAKKQEEMYQYFMGDRKQTRQTTNTEIMQQQQPITIQQNDGISMGMQHCFFRMDDDPNDNQELNFFNQQVQEQDVIFYSQNMISMEDVDMKDDYEAYFDV